MKSSPLLLRELRSLFGFIRGLMIFWLVVLPLFFFADSHTSQRWVPAFGQVDFDPALITLRTAPSAKAKLVEGIKLRAVTGELVVADKAEGAPLLAATRIPVFTAKMARALLLFAIAHLLWRLCQNVERGEIFSKGNFLLVRGLGAALVARPIVGAITETWRIASVARYVEDHVTFEGLRVVVSSSGLGWWERVIENASRYADFDFSLFVTGLLVLALAEVFRRGLALKQENDLTV